jgi:TRAP-type C4-dicarboxylate transport system permease small subunit
MVNKITSPDRATSDAQSQAEAQPHWLKRLDDMIFILEGRIVTLAAFIMTCTVCLDIVNRLLKDQKSSIFCSIMNGFGLFGAQDPAMTTGEVTPLIVLIGLPWLLGWSVYAAQHRGEPHVKLNASKHGLWWLLGALISTVIIYHVPSKFVCMGLALGIGLGLIYQRAGHPAPIAILSVLLAWGSLDLPQGYIWSQELSLILLAWMAFLGASMATHEQKHIKVSALASLIPKRLRPYGDAMGLMITACFAAYLTTSLYQSVFGAMGSWVMGERRPSTGLPAWIILFSGVIAFALITLRSFAYGVAQFINPIAETESEIDPKEMSH